MFVLSFKNDNDHPMRDSSDDYCMPFLEIEDFNALIDNKPVFDHLVRNKQSAYERTVKMFRNNDCAPGNLLSKYYILVGTDLSRQKNTSIPQETNFTKKIEDDGATMFFIAEKQQKAI